MGCGAGCLRGADVSIPAALAVLAEIARATGPVSDTGDAPFIRYSVRDLEGATRFSRSTVSTALTAVERVGLIAVDARRGQTLTATLPFVYQNSTALTYIGGTPVPTGGPDAELVRQRQPGTRVPMGPGGKRRAASSELAAIAAAAGTQQVSEVVAERGDFRLHVGDPVGQLDVELHRGFGFVRTLTVSATAKAPIADSEEGIGTGEWDYGAGAMVALGSARTFVFANATYWVLGDMPDLRLRNTVSYGASGGQVLGRGRWSLSGSMVGSTSVVANADAPLSAGVGVGYLYESGRSLTAGVSVGLSESSAGVSTYVGWRIPMRTAKR